MMKRVSSSLSTALMGYLTNKSNQNKNKKMALHFGYESHEKLFEDGWV